MSKHYDVAILGAGVGALTAAALLARRSWRVLVLGQGWRPPSYQYDGVTLARRPFAFLAGSSPAWSRVLVELAQSQTFRRRTVALDPMFQVLARRLRLEVPPEVQLFGKEIDRVYPEVRRVVVRAHAGNLRVRRVRQRRGGGRRFPSQADERGHVLVRRVHKIPREVSSPLGVSSLPRISRAAVRMR